MRMRPAAIPVGIGLTAAFLYSNFLIDWVLRGFAGMDRVVSYLETPGEPNATILRVTDVVCAILVISLLPAVRRALPAGRANDLVIGCTVVFALGAVIAAFVAMPCGLGETCTSAADRRSANIHDAASVVSETAVFLGVAAAWWATRRDGPAWVARVTPWLFWIVGVGTTAVFTYLGLYTDNQTWTAYSQRVHILGVSVWLACLGFIAAAAAPTREGAPR